MDLVQRLMPAVWPLLVRLFPLSASDFRRHLTKKHDKKERETARHNTDRARISKRREDENNGQRKNKIDLGVSLSFQSFAPL